MPYAMGIFMKKLNRMNYPQLIRPEKILQFGEGNTFYSTL